MGRTKWGLVAAFVANLVTPAVLSGFAHWQEPDAWWVLLMNVVFLASAGFAIAGFVPRLERTYPGASRNCLRVAWVVYGAGWLYFAIAMGKAYVDTHWQ